MAIIRKKFINTGQKNLTIKQFDKRKFCYLDICVNHKMVVHVFESHIYNHHHDQKML